MHKILLFSFKKIAVFPYNFRKRDDIQKNAFYFCALEYLNWLTPKICTSHTRKDSRRREHFIPKWHSELKYPLQQFCFGRSQWLHMNQPDVNDESTVYNIHRRLKTLLADTAFRNTMQTPLDLHIPKCLCKRVSHNRCSGLLLFVAPFEYQNDLEGVEVPLTFPGQFQFSSSLKLPKGALDTVQVLESTCGSGQVSAGVSLWKAVKSWSESGNAPDTRTLTGGNF